LTTNHSKIFLKYNEIELYLQYIDLFFDNFIPPIPGKLNVDYLNRKIRVCTECPLHRTRNHAIPGAGPVPCHMLIIGQAPGNIEDQINALFVGPSGQIFDQLIRHARITRESFYLTNLIKCMLPKSRRPARDEIMQCAHYLRQEIRMVQPSVMVPLGFHATRFLFKEFGLPFPPKHDVHALFGDIIRSSNHWIYPLRHPTALLFNPDKKEVMQKNYGRLYTLMNDDSYV